MSNSGGDASTKAATNTDGQKRTLSPPPVNESTDTNSDKARNKRSRRKKFDPKSQPGASVKPSVTPTASIPTNSASSARKKTSTSSSTSLPPSKSATSSTDSSMNGRRHRRRRDRSRAVKMDAEELQRKRRELEQKLQTAKQEENNRKKRLEVEVAARQRREEESRLAALRIAREARLKELHDAAKQEVAAAFELQSMTISRDVSRFINQRVSEEAAEQQKRGDFDDMGLGLESFVGDSGNNKHSALPLVFQDNTLGQLGEAYRAELRARGCLPSTGRFTAPAGSGRDLKKVQSLRARLKLLAVDKDIDTTLNLAQNLNLHKFESEIAACVSENSYVGAVQVERAVLFCELMHRAYAESFSEPLGRLLCKEVVEMVGAVTMSEDAREKTKENEFIERLKGKLGLLLELYVRGLFSASLHAPVHDIVLSLVSRCHKAMRDARERERLVRLQRDEVRAREEARDREVRELGVWGGVLLSCLERFGAEVTGADVNGPVYARALRYATGYVADADKERLARNEQAGAEQTAEQESSAAAEAENGPVVPIVIAPIPVPMLRCAPRKGTAVFPAPDSAAVLPQPQYATPPAVGSVAHTLLHTPYTPLADLAPVFAPLMAPFVLPGASSIAGQVSLLHSKLSNALAELDKERIRIIKRNRKLVRFRGVLNQQQQDSERSVLQALDSLLAVTNALGASLGAKAYVLKELPEEDQWAVSMDDTEKESLQHCMYVDEEERKFYEALMDIRDSAPKGVVTVQSGGAGDVQERRNLRAEVEGAGGEGDKVVKEEREEEKERKREEEDVDQGKKEKKDKKEKKEDGEKRKEKKDDKKDKKDKKEKKESKDKEKRRFVSVEADDYVDAGDHGSVSDEEDPELREVSRAYNLIAHVPAAPRDAAALEQEAEAERLELSEEELLMSKHSSVTHVIAPIAPAGDDEEDNIAVVALGSAAAPAAAVPAVPLRTQADMDVLLASLPSAATAAAVDVIVSSLLPLMSTRPKQRLLRLISHVTTLRSGLMDRIPFYVRLLATFARVAPWVGEETARIVLDEFHRLSRTSPGSSLSRRMDLKLRNIRLISELVKFRVCAPAVAFTAWSALLTSPTLHNIHMLCALLEHCGRWLYCGADTHSTMRAFLDSSARHIASGTIPHATVAALQTALQNCRPPPTKAAAAAPVSVVEAYIRHLLHTVLPTAVRPRARGSSSLGLPAGAGAGLAAGAGAAVGVGPDGRTAADTAVAAGAAGSMLSPNAAVAAGVASRGSVLASVELDEDVVDYLVTKLAALPWDGPVTDLWRARTWREKQASLRGQTQATGTPAAAPAESDPVAASPLSQVADALGLPVLPTEPVWVVFLRNALDLAFFPPHAIPALVVLLTRLAFTAVDVAPVDLSLASSASEPDTQATEPLELSSSAPLALCRARFPPLLPVLADCLIEDIKGGMDVAVTTSRQVRLLQVRLLGTMVAYNVLPVQTLFDVLYLLLSHGHTRTEKGTVVSFVDPPYDTFRVNLVLELALAAQNILLSPLYQPRFEVFLAFFQRYLHLKRVIPIDTEFALKALFALVHAHAHQSVVMAPLNAQGVPMPLHGSPSRTAPEQRDPSHPFAWGVDVLAPNAAQPQPGFPSTQHPYRGVVSLSPTRTNTRLGSYAECERVIAGLLTEARARSVVKKDRVLWLRYADVCRMFALEGEPENDDDRNRELNEQLHVAEVEEDEDDDEDEEDEDEDDDEMHVDASVLVDGEDGEEDEDDAFDTELLESDYDEAMSMVSVASTNTTGAGPSGDEDEESEASGVGACVDGSAIDIDELAALFEGELALDEGDEGDEGEDDGLGGALEMVLEEEDGMVPTADQPSASLLPLTPVVKSTAATHASPETLMPTYASVAAPATVAAAEARAAADARLNRYKQMEQELNRRDRARSHMLRHTHEDNRDLFFADDYGQLMDDVTADAVAGGTATAAGVDVNVLEQRIEREQDNAERYADQYSFLRRRRPGANANADASSLTGLPSRADLELEQRMEQMLLNDQNYYGMHNSHRVKVDKMNQVAVFLRSNREKLEEEARKNRETAETSGRVGFRFLSRTVKGEEELGVENGVPLLAVPSSSELALQYLAEEALRREQDEIVKRVTKEQIRQQQLQYQKQSFADHRDISIDAVAQRSFLSVDRGGTTGSAVHHMRAQKLNNEYQSSPEFLKGYGGREKQQGLDDDISIFTKWQFSSVMKGGKAKAAKKGGR